MRRMALVAGVLLLARGHALGAVDPDLSIATEPQAVATSAPATAPDVPVVDDEKTWAFSLSAYTYIVPEGRDYVQPTITADHDRLHLEARYNYEGLDTGSAWVGCNFSGGEQLTWELTPMVGGVFGDYLGVAPGYKLSLGWRSFEFYSEGEYVLDTGDSSNNYFYTWTDLTYSFTDWLRAGVVIQRTRDYESDLDVQRGLLVAASYKRFDFTACVFNLGWEKPTFVFAVAMDF